MDIINWWKKFYGHLSQCDRFGRKANSTSFIEEKANKKQINITVHEIKKSLSWRQEKILRFFIPNDRNGNNNLCNKSIETESKSWVILLYLKLYLSKTRIHDEQSQKLQCYFDDMRAHVIDNNFQKYYTQYVLPHYMIINLSMNDQNGWNT